MLLLGLQLFGYVAAYIGTANYYDLASQGSCGVATEMSQIRVSVESSLYNNRTGCGNCIQINHLDKTVIAYITDLCRDCKEEQILLSKSGFEKLGETSLSAEVRWERVECPYTVPSIGWHINSNKYWARFVIFEFANGIKEVQVYQGGTWNQLHTSKWGEFEAPEVNHKVARKFRIQVVGNLGPNRQYDLVFPYFGLEPPHVDPTENYYPGPAIKLVEADTQPYEPIFIDVSVVPTQSHPESKPIVSNSTSNETQAKASTTKLDPVETDIGQTKAESHAFASKVSLLTMFIVQYLAFTLLNKY